MNKAAVMNRCEMKGMRRQQGVVLLIALIILVAMTLAGIGMMRSVDTGTVIAGNLAFRQSTLQASDVGTSAAFNSLAQYANTGNLIDKSVLNLNNGQPCPVGTSTGLCSVSVNIPGYKATPLKACEVMHNCPLASDYSWWVLDSSWAGTPTLHVTDPGNPSIDIATVNYVIHRMCTIADSPDAPTQVCQMITRPAFDCSKTQIEPCISTSVYYRITTRSIGPRNTISYTQTMVTISK